MRADDRVGDRRSEYRELHDFSCEKCGSYSVTTAAGEMLDQQGASGIVALGLIPRWSQALEGHIVDQSLVEEAVNGPKQSPDP